MMRGVIVGKRVVDDRPERGLLAAVVLQAILDARGGDAEAARWLDEVAGMLGAVFGVDMGEWRALGRVTLRCDARRRNGRPNRPSGAERSKAYREKKRLEVNNGRRDCQQTATQAGGSDRP